MNVVDIVIIAILLIFIIIGICKGFMFSVLDLFSSTVNIILAILLAKPMSSLLSTMGLASSIKASYVSRFAQMQGFNTNLVNMTEQELSAHISNTIEQSSLPGISKTTTSWFLNVTPEQIANKESINLSDILSTAYANFWNTLIAFMVSLVLICLVIFIISRIVKKSREIKPVRVTDRFLGIIFGLIKGSLVICVIFAILNLFSPSGVLKPVFDSIYASKIGSWAFEQVTVFVNNNLSTYLATNLH